MKKLYQAPCAEELFMDTEQLLESTTETVPLDNSTEKEIQESEEILSRMMNSMVVADF